jgi:hypothetical protein
VKLFGYYIVHEREVEYQASRLQAWMDIAVRWYTRYHASKQATEVARFSAELCYDSPELIEGGPCSRCKDPTKAERYKDNVDFILG